MKARGPTVCTTSLTSSARRKKQRSSAISAPFPWRRSSSASTKASGAWCFSAHATTSRINGWKRPRSCRPGWCRWPDGLNASSPCLRAASSMRSARSMMSAPASRQKALRSGVRALARLGLQIPFPPQDRQQLGTFHAQHGTTLPLRDDRRLPPCLGAQHPAGRDPALFDHLPYDGLSLSIGFDLRSAAQQSPAVADVCYPLGRTHGRDGAVKRRDFITLVGGVAAWPLTLHTK